MAKAPVQLDIPSVTPKKPVTPIIQPVEPTKKPEKPVEKMVTTSLLISKSDLAMLKAVALNRSKIHGGRASVTAVVMDLIDQHRDDLKHEAGETVKTFL